MTLAFKKYSPDGSTSGEVTAPEGWSEFTPNKSLIHQALVQELANARAGSAKAKTRAEVRGGGRKPRKQKGSGSARVGSIRSPLWVGGGVTFGPIPRDFSKSMPKQMRRKAVFSALVANPEKLEIVSDFGFITEPKTKFLAQFLASIHHADSKVLILADAKEEVNKNLLLAGRNIPNVTLRHPGQLTVKGLLEADVILLAENALNIIAQKEY